MTNEETRPAADVSQVVPAATPTIVDFQTIANGSATVLVRLDDSVYTLRRTKNNRLILQK